MLIKDAGRKRPHGRHARRLLYLFISELELLAVIVGIRHSFQLGKGLLGQRLHTLVHIRQRGGDLTYRPTTVSVVVHTDQVFFSYGKVHLSYLQFVFLGSGCRLFQAGGLFAVGELLGTAELYSTVLVYYTEHGVQIDGENYFVPVDCEYKSSKAIFTETQLVGIDAITDFMTANPSKTNIMILDACRSNPGFVKDIVGTGLTEVMAGNGTLIAFATAPNEVALASQSEDENSFYTKALLDNIVRPNVKIEDMFKSVRNDVIDRSNGEQVP